MKVACLALLTPVSTGCSTCAYDRVRHDELGLSLDDEAAPWLHHLQHCLLLQVLEMLAPLARDVVRAPVLLRRALDGRLVLEG